MIYYMKMNTGNARSAHLKSLIAGKIVTSLHKRIKGGSSHILRQRYSTYTNIIKHIIYLIIFTEAIHYLSD